MSVKGNNAGTFVQETTLQLLNEMMSPQRPMPGTHQTSQESQSLGVGLGQSAQSPKPPMF